MHMQALAIFWPAVRIVRPYNAAQLLGGNIRAPPHGVVDSLLNRWQVQLCWQKWLAICGISFGLGYCAAPSLVEIGSKQMARYTSQALDLDNSAGRNLSPSIEGGVRDAEQAG